MQQRNFPVSCSKLMHGVPLDCKNILHQFDIFVKEDFNCYCGNMTLTDGTLLSERTELGTTFINYGKIHNITPL